MTTEHQGPENNDAPLPLSELSSRLSAETLEWLEVIEKANKKHKEDEEALGTNLFDTNDDNDEVYLRVQQWSSSTQNPNGIGGYQGCNNDENNADETSITIKYVLSDAVGGHGDDVWAASRHVSNLLSNPTTCQSLLKSKQQCENPLLGLEFLELGAGGGLPSWTALKCGARVVCTDQPIPERIRYMAESAERNYQDTVSEFGVNDERLEYAKQARVCPYSWGNKDLSEILNNQDDLRFDVIVAADCIYNPTSHAVLLESIDLLLAQDGVALLPFALHGNTDDANVWEIVPRAQDCGFQVETLESQQLVPQSSSMNPKRGLVNMLRLTRK